MAPHSSTLAWKMPWMEELGRLQSMGLLRVGHDWATSLPLFHFHVLEKETATYSTALAWRIPGREGAWWAAIYGTAQSRTWLKWLSSSSSSIKICGRTLGLKINYLKYKVKFLHIWLVQAVISLMNSSITWVSENNLLVRINSLLERNQICVKESLFQGTSNRETLVILSYIRKPNFKVK